MPHYTKLRGTWIKQGNEFTSPKQDFKLLLVDRPNPKPRQPKRYILEVLPSGGRRYISGILEGNTIDYDGYRFKFIQDKANEFTIV